MITLTLDQVIAAQAALPDLLAQRLPAKDGFALARLSQRLAADVAAYTAARDRLIEIYGVPDGTTPDGRTQYRFEGEGVEEVNRQHAELIAQTVEVPEVKIKLSTLGPIAPATLLPLLWLIEDDTEGATAEAAGSAV